ncbi:MAG: FG-GAP-like repeat-containing protein [Myxococcales bacterium]
MKKQWNNRALRDGLFSMTLLTTFACGNDRGVEDLGTTQEAAYVNDSVTQWYDTTPPNTINVCINGYFKLASSQDPNLGQPIPGSPPCAGDFDCDTSKSRYCDCKGGSCGDDGRTSACAADPSKCTCFIGQMGTWSSTTTEFVNSRRWLREALAEWSNVSDLRISVADVCPSPLTGTMPIRLQGSNDQGGIAGHAVAGVGARLSTNEGWTQGVEPEAQFAVASFDGDLTSANRFKATVAHEFGHAVGFNHEHERAVRPDNACVNGYGHSAGDRESQLLSDYDPDALVNYCRDLNRNDDFNDDPALPKLSALDTLGAQELFGFFGSSSLTARNFCNGAGERPFVGRFNQDSRADLLCVNSQTGQMRIDFADASGHYSSIDWTASRNFCVGTNDRLFVGDTNADGRDDLICGNASTGKVLVSLATTSGTFAGPGVLEANNFCNGAAPGSIAVGDFSGDKRVDLLCRRANGGLEVNLADSAGHYGASEQALTLASYCTSSSQDLLVGDYDGDGRSDLVCYDRSNAEVSVVQSEFTAANVPMFKAAVWTGTPTSFPTGCQPSTLLLADLNADGRKDLVCRSGGTFNAALAQGDGGYPRANFRGPFARWCSDLPNDQLLAGPAKGGVSDDLLCISRNGNQSQQFAAVPAFSTSPSAAPPRLSGTTRCDVANSIELGAPGTQRTVSNHACLMIRTGYPSWWGSAWDSDPSSGPRTLKLQDPRLGVAPVPFVWSNPCGGPSGSGTFRRDWDDKLLNVVDRACTTFIELQGPGNGTVDLVYWAQ